MIKNSLFLYKTINDGLLDVLNIEISNINLSYEEQNTVTDLTFDREKLYKFYLGTVPEYWEPNENNLIVSRELSINNIECLFEDDGVANEDTTLGIAAKIHSRTSDFSKTIDLDYDIKKESLVNKVEFNYTFEPATLRGNVFVEIFIFNKYTSKNVLGFANEKGINLGIIDAFEIVVDGDGSTFPIVEVKKPDEPLWKLVMNWNDLNTELFDQENIRLEVNVKHKMYEYIFRDSKPSRVLLFEIMSNVMSQIIFKAVHDTLYDPSLKEEQSITSVVEYWIMVYNIDISSFENISHSLRLNLESEMVG